MTAWREKLAVAFEPLRPLCIKPADKYLNFPYCIPGGYYVELWDWDGFFISLPMAGRKSALPEHMKCLSLKSITSSNDMDYVPCCVTTDGPEPGHRSFQMKPLMAQGSELAGRLLGSDEWLVPHFETLCRIVQSREKTHYDRKSGLFVWDHAMDENYNDETGAPLASSGDQSPKGEHEGCFIGWNLLLLG